MNFPNKSQIAVELNMRLEKGETEKTKINRFIHRYKTYQHAEGQRFPTVIKDAISTLVQQFKTRERLAFPAWVALMIQGKASTVSATAAFASSLQTT